MPKTDAELVEGARRGDDAARDELVRRYQRQTSLLAASLVNDFSEAEDLGQEAFVRAFQNLDLLIDPSRFGPWLRRIVFGVSIDWLRSFRPDLFRGWDGLEEHGIPDASPSPLDHLLLREMAERVRAALAALPPRYRVPIRLFHMDGLSHSKIAETLGVPVGTVRSLVSRARRKLAPLLAEYASEAVSEMDEVFQEQNEMSAGTNRFLHVANGHSVTGTIHMAGIPGTSCIWADVLHEGPVPDGLTDEQLLNVRARHLTEDSDKSFEGSYEDTITEMNAWRKTIDNHESYDELILWYEHDLFDQLNLIQVLSRIGRTLPSAKAASLICIGSFPGRQNFKGLGELTPDELASLLETRQRISDAQYSLAERAWLAFRAPNPRQLEDLLRADTSALPFLASALQRHLEEFPWTIDGLSRTERRLMELAQHEPVDLWAAFPRMHDLETAFYIADASFWTLVHNLASSSPPLVAVDIKSRTPQQLPRASISLTEMGRAVLQGVTDRVRRCGLDRWLGGVHLEGSTAMWRWDESEKRIVKG